MSDDDRNKATPNLRFSATFKSFILRLKIISLRKLCKGFEEVWLKTLSNVDVSF